MTVVTTGTEKKLPFFSKFEVAEHCISADCWVSYFGKVYDLTTLIKTHNGPLTQPILKFAGQDISHWFDARTKEPKTYIDPDTNVAMPFCPYGRFVHIPPPTPTADWSTDFGIPWWADQTYLIGNLSVKERKIKVMNMLSGQCDLIKCCTEETLEAIRERYLAFNAHAHSYTWKRLGRPLNMKKNLTENGVPDESQEMTELSIDPDDHIATIHIYFNDDLTVK